MKIDIGISAKDREVIADGLSHLLADSYTLYLQSHNFHWNVTGPMFQTLHVLFMEHYTEQWNALDLIAERIRSLGLPAPGTYKEFVAARLDQGSRGHAERHGDDPHPRRAARKPWRGRRAPRSRPPTPPTISRPAIS